MNSSTGQTQINNCVIVNNEADGIKYVHHDERPDEQKNRNERLDLCTSPTTSQIFPITIVVNGKGSSSGSQNGCTKVRYLLKNSNLDSNFSSGFSSGKKII